MPNLPPFPPTSVKVYYPSYAPSVMTECGDIPHMHVTANCPFPGLMVEMLNLLAADANLTIIPVVAEDLDVDVTPTAVRDVPVDFNLFDLVLNGSVDVLAAPLQRSQPRERLFDFSDNLYYVQTRLMSPIRSKAYRKLWSFFETYDDETWVAVGVVWVLQWLLAVLVRRFEAKMTKRRPPGVWETAWQILRIQLMQPEPLECLSIAGRISTVVFTLIQCSVLFGLYSTWILAHLIHEERTPDIQVIETIVSRIETGEYQMVTSVPDAWIFDTINVSNVFPYAEFRRALTKNPLGITGSVEETLARVSDGKAVVFSQDDDRFHFEARSMCRIHSTRERMPIVSAHLMFRKGSRLKHRFNYAIERNKQFLNRLRNKYWGLRERKRLARHCELDHPPKGGHPLGIIPYTGLVAVCGSILMVAFSAFMAELLYHSTRGSRITPMPSDPPPHRAMTFDGLVTLSNHLPIRVELLNSSESFC